MTKSSRFPAALTLALSIAVIGSVGCEKNMGSDAGGGDGWKKVETSTQAVRQDLPKADAVNVTYYYLPG
jgi:hypothetical protein